MKRNSEVNLEQDGFTLLEIMVAMGIFILIVGAITIFSIRTIEAGMRSRVMQNSLENARATIETLAKQLRTSYYVKINHNEKNIFFVDNRNFDKYCYEFSDGQLVVKKQAFEYVVRGDHFGGERYQNVKGCQDYFSERQVVVGDENEPRKILVDGLFRGKQTNLSILEESSSDKFRRGFVQTVIELTYVGSGDLNSTGPTESNKIIIQSGVSLRDYGVPGVELERLGLIIDN